MTVKIKTYNFNVYHHNNQIFVSLRDLSKILKQDFRTLSDIVTKSKFSFTKDQLIDLKRHNIIPDVPPKEMNLYRNCNHYYAFSFEGMEIFLSKFPISNEYRNLIYSLVFNI